MVNEDGGRLGRVGIRFSECALYSPARQTRGKIRKTDLHEGTVALALPLAAAGNPGYFQAGNSPLL